MKYCCTNCFTDKFLISKIEIEGLKNNCSFCGTNNISCIDTGQLIDDFMPIIELYEQSTDKPERQLVGELIEEDWLIFNIKDTNQNELLRSIFDDELYMKKQFIRPVYSDSKINLWNNFKNEILENNRFFPEEIIKIKELEFLFSILGTTSEIELFQKFYRGRIQQSENTPIPADKMGQPPKLVPNSGRINPIGISYLYLGSTIQTVINEIRPHVGHHVSIAEFSVKSELNIINLRDPRNTISPFLLTDDELPRIHSDLNFITVLAEEISYPVLPKDSNLKYLPSQYISELIKKMGFDGVMYSSSVSAGYNLALFNSDKVNMMPNIKSYRIRESFFDFI